MIKLNFFEFSFYLFSLLKLFLFLSIVSIVQVYCILGLGSSCYVCSVYFVDIVLPSQCLEIFQCDVLLMIIFIQLIVHVFWHHVQQLMIIFTVLIIQNDSCTVVSRMTGALDHICNYSFVESEQLHLNGNLYL